MEAAFARGAHAVLGWPIDDAINATAARKGKPMAQPDLQVDRRADPPRRQRGADREAREHAQARPVARLQADALHQLAGVRPARRDQLVPPRDHDARLPAPEALARAAARHRQQGRQPEAGDVRRGAPRPADGRARAPAAATRRCAARCSSAASSRCSTGCSRKPSPSCSARSRCPSASTRRWSKSEGPLPALPGDGAGGRGRVAVRLSRGGRAAC